MSFGGHRYRIPTHSPPGEPEPVPQGLLNHRPLPGPSPPLPPHYPSISIAFQGLPLLHTSWPLAHSLIHRFWKPRAWVQVQGPPSPARQTCNRSLSGVPTLHLEVGNNTNICLQLLSGCSETIIGSCRKLHLCLSSSLFFLHMHLGPTCAYTRRNRGPALQPPKPRSRFTST